MIVLEMHKVENSFDELVSLLPENTYSIIIPKCLDGSEMIQIFLELSKVTIPALASYFVGRKSRATIIWKYHGKVDLEMTAAINNRELSEAELSNYFYLQVEKSEEIDASKEEHSSENLN